MEAEFHRLPLEEQRNCIKQALANIVPKGAVKEVADAAGLSASTLFKWMESGQDGWNGLRPELIAIIQYTKGFEFLTWFCGLFAHLAVPLPRPEQSLEAISRQIALVLGRTGEVCQVVIEAADPASDGGPEITYTEYRAIETVIIKAQEQLAGLRLAVRRKSETHPSWRRRFLQGLLMVKNRVGGSHGRK